MIKESVMHDLANVERWNRRRVSSGGESVTLTGLELRGWSLAGADLSRCDLAFTDLTGADLSGASLREARLAGAILDDTNLSNANLSGVKALGSRWLEPEISRGIAPPLHEALSLQGAQLHNAKLDGASLAWANFERCDAVASSFQDADLRFTQARGARFVHCTLDGARMDGVEWEATDLRHTSFARTSCLGANFCNVKATSSMWQDSLLRNVRFRDSDLGRSSLRGVVLGEGVLDRCSLEGAWCNRASFLGATLNGATLDGAVLREADFLRASAVGASFRNADLSLARFIETDLSDATVIGCRVYGSCCWRTRTDGLRQEGLVVTRADEAPIVVESLEMAQVIFMLTEHQQMKRVIEGLSKTVVLLLGRFNDRVKASLGSLRTELRQHGLTPVVFDFEQPTTRGLDETVLLIASLSRFIIADLTDATSAAMELQLVAPQFPLIPIVPVIQSGEAAFGMFPAFAARPNVLGLAEYRDIRHLREMVVDLIARADERARALALGGASTEGPHPGAK